MPGVLSGSDIPTRFTCEFSGPNIAIGKPRYISSAWQNQNPTPLNDNYWGNNCELCSNYFHGGWPASGRNWVAVDLGERYAVKAFRMQGKQGSVSYWNSGLTFWLGDVEPVSFVPMDTSQWNYCTNYFFNSMEYESGEVPGVTCEVLTFGRYAAIYGMRLASEVGVYGVKASLFA